ncbi:MAG: nuclease, partial [Actinomycetia bacterium]|nr:nuclease [Actinomycetes bacterium]
MYLIKSYSLAAAGEVRAMDDFGEGKRYFYEEYGPGARDQRLELFGEGGWADRARGSGWLALQAGDVSRPEALGRALDDELLGIGRAWKALETWVFTRKLVVVRELIRRYPLNERDEPGAAAGGLPDEWDPRLHHEVAAALGISLVAAGRLVNLAWTLEARLPGIGKALEGCRLDPSAAWMIAGETSVLDGEALFARAEELILAGLAGCATWTALQRLVQRAVILVDPEGARKRREQAEREHARLRFWRENCGTFAMQATGLPADEALAANARIEGRARAYKAARVGHPMDILRVMAYLDLINEVTIAQRVAWAQADAAARDAAARNAAARN